MAILILFNKPFRVLSQFSDKEREPENRRQTLADYLSAPGFRAAGRLDFDSEGLLLLTDHGGLQQQIANPKHKQWKTYLAQVEGEIDEPALAQLRRGLKLKDGPTLPAKARAIAAPEWLWPRQPPVRERKTVPDSWLELSIQEGRNRQVRRMCAAVGFPVLRLVRQRIADWDLGDLAPGQYKRVEIQLPSSAAKAPSPKRSRRPSKRRRAKKPQ